MVRGVEASGCCRERFLRPALGGRTAGWDYGAASSDGTEGRRWGLHRSGVAATGCCKEGGTGSLARSGHVKGPYSLIRQAHSIHEPASRVASRPRRPPRGSSRGAALGSAARRRAV